MWSLLFLCSVIVSYGVQGMTGVTAPPDWTTGPIYPNSAISTAPCGNYLYGSRGTFYSPNYPNNYLDNVRCTWHIRPGTQIVRLEFISVDIENSPSCRYDAVQVYDGTSTSSRLLGTVCGTDNSTFYSTGSYMTVYFRTDGSQRRSGFRAEYQVVARGSCRNNCGYQVGSCSCSSSCEYRGNCCQDKSEYCSSTSAPPPSMSSPVDVSFGQTAQPSCRYNCGYNFGSCSCSSSCRYNGNCCYDYYRYCGYTTFAPTTAQPSCRYNCGYYFGSCSCSSSCQYNGNCCHDYYRYCGYTTFAPATAQPSCRYNCGYYFGSCSCSSSCQYNGNCCHDYYRYCGYTTPSPPTRTTAQLSCRYNCGYHMGSCSCSSSCQYNGNCCYDYYRYCGYATPSPPTPATAQPSCRYNCGYSFGSCSCSSSCRYNGNCCHDYYRYCGYTTFTPTTAQPSCRYNCGYHMGSCSCSSSCQYSGNCCYDYYRYCGYATPSPPTPATAQLSCRYNCGYHMGSCSCSSSCRYNGNCCHDYYHYCGYPTPTAQPSCRYNCGYHMGSCSCSSSCQYNGNCCYDYYHYCGYTTYPTPTAHPCGGSLFGSGTFSSPNYPSYYHDNAYCTWQLRASYDQRIFLAFTYLQLENCCSCDYIAVYDGPSVNSRYLGRVCNDSQSSFYSSSNYMTVLFRTDGSVVGRGFSAEFASSLPPSSGRVECSSDNMNIIIKKSYLNSLGYDGHSLYVNDPNCRPSFSTYEVVFRFPLNTCGTIQKTENGRVVYTNTLRAYTSSSGIITRQSHFNLKVGCRMEQDSVAQIMYLVYHRNSSSLIGTGKFDTMMDFYTSSSFYNKVYQVPYEVTLNQYLYVQVQLRRSDSNLVLFLDTCVTSPTPHDFQTRPYYLVRNGCSMDNTYMSYTTGTRYYARFAFKAFQFLRATDSVYIQCKVLICPASDYNSRCRRGCSKRTARDLGSEHNSQTVVLGPIKLKDSEKKEEETQEQDKV